MDVAGFLLFSTIEGIAVLSVALYLFRVKVTKHIWSIVIMSLLISFQNYVIRDMLALVEISPIINLLLTVLFFKTVIRIPLFWSAVITVTGYISYALIQSSVLLLSFGYFTIEKVSGHSVEGYELQLISSLLALGGSWFIYSRGLGFTFEFEKLRFKWERIAVLTLITFFALGLCIMMYFQDIKANFVIILFSLAVFLYYALRKEVEEKL